MRMKSTLLSALMTMVGFFNLSAQEITVTLLGTGGPELTPDRQGAATLVSAGGQMLLFDTGRGVMQRLYESRVKITQVTRVFYTHLHSDHIEGLPNLWMSSWFLLGRMTPMEFHGPAGTRQMLKGMEMFFGHDLLHRVHGVDAPEGLRYSVHEFEADGVVFELNGVKVTAFAVDHKDGNPAFGFRVDYGGRSVVLSGDCTYSTNLLAHASGVDVIVHNVFAVSPAVMATDPVKKIVAQKLASPEQVGALFIAAKPRLGALSHVIRVNLTDEDVQVRIRSAGYDGALAIGVDRMKIEIGDEIRVNPPASLHDLPDAAKRGDW
jgi:ribonuclease Z